MTFILRRMLRVRQVGSLVQKGISDSLNAILFEVEKSLICVLMALMNGRITMMIMGKISLV